RGLQAGSGRGREELVPNHYDVGMNPNQSGNLSLATILAAAPQDAERIAIWNRPAATSWGELAWEFTRQTQKLAPLARQRVGLALQADPVGIARLAALESLASDVFLFDAELPPPRRAEWSRRFGLRALLTNSSAPDAEPAEPTATDPRLSE